MLFDTPKLKGVLRTTEQQSSDSEHPKRRMLQHKQDVQISNIDLEVPFE